MKLHLIEQMRASVPYSRIENQKQTQCPLQLVQHFIGFGIVTATNQNALSDLLASAEAIRAGKHLDTSLLDETPTKRRNSINFPGDLVVLRCEVIIKAEKEQGSMPGQIPKAQSQIRGLKRMLT